MIDLNALDINMNHPYRCSFQTHLTNALLWAILFPNLFRTPIWTILFIVPFTFTILVVGDLESSI